MTNFKKIAIALVLLAALTFGQTALTSTTLSANITANQTTFVVASLTGIGTTGNAGAAQGGIGSPGSQSASYLYVDTEQMIVTSTNTTAVTVTVRRGSSGTPARAHNSSAVVWIGPSRAFQTAPFDPAGQCVRTVLPYVPYINVTTGHMFDCLGVTTAGQWFQTNTPGGNLGLIGTTVASATTITPTGLIFAVSGTTAVATITVPAGFTPGMSITILPTGIFATTTAGNIQVITSATVVSRALVMTWSGTKWYPSYIS